MSTQQASRALRVHTGNGNTRVYMILKQGSEAMVSCTNQTQETRMFLMSILNVQKVIFC
jgi:hypothetical protein